MVTWWLVSPGWSLAGRLRASAVTWLSPQFADGVYLVLLMGLLEGYFVPLHSFFLTPDSFEQKVSGMESTKGSPARIVTWGSSC